MSKKSRLVILDADVIIVCHELGIWNQIISYYSIQVPETVVEQEAKYFVSRKTQKRISIALNSEVNDGKIEKMSADASEMANLANKVTDDFFQAIDPGETEAIALLFSKKDSSIKLCTGDQAAMKAISALGLGSSIISMEKLCTQANVNTNLRPNFKESACKNQLAKGIVESKFFVKK